VVSPVGPDKVLPLEDAIERWVRPRTTLHFAFTHNRPAASMAALLRRFRGTSPGFTLAHLFTAGPAIAMLSEGLVRKLVTALVLEPYPAPAPSRPARRALANGDLELEHHSVLSYVARLQAAALGLPGLPVRGPAGTTMAEEPPEAFRERPDGLVEARPLVPDLSFVHAPCADRHGNVLLAPPCAEGTWGALAAREGVVVTVERLVEPEVLRRHALLPSVPSHRVRSVSVAPMGAHPAGQAAGGIEGVEAYGDDVAFYSEGRAAGRSETDWQRWVERWLLEPADRETYLARLGPERALWLMGTARPDSWRAELLAARERLDLGAPSNATERMTIAASRLLASKVDVQDHASILSGQGSANLAAWLAHGLLADRGRTVQLVAEVGMAGYVPRPCDPFLFNHRNLATCTARADATAALGLLVGGSQARCLGSLGAGQVDAQGRFNSTRLADGTLLVGSGGAADVAATAAEVVLTLPAGAHRLVEELPYVTGVGDRVTAVVTDRGIFEKARGDAPLRLTRLVGPPAEVETHVRDLRQRVGFSFQTAADLEVEPEPTAESLERLRLYDPERAFLGPPDA